MYIIFIQLVIYHIKGSAIRVLNVTALLQ